MRARALVLLGILGILFFLATTLSAHMGGHFWLEQGALKHGLPTIYGNSRRRTSTQDSSKPAATVGRVDPIAPLVQAGTLLADPSDFLDKHPIRIYVYDPRDFPPLRPLLTVRTSIKYAPKCANSMWGEEFKLHDMMLNSTLRTRDPRQATFFFVPLYSKCDSISYRGKYTEKLLIEVLSRSPWFARWGGRDHMFVFPSGSGPHFLSNWTKYLTEAAFLMAESSYSSRGAPRAPYYNPHKDVIIPGFITAERLTALMEQGRMRPNTKEARPKLACFAGSLQGLPSRVAVHELAQEYPSEIFSYSKKFPSFELYAGNLSECRFCLIPRGQSAWTLRFFESMFLECIPVVINNYLELPFESLIDYSGMTIKWPAQHVDASLVGHLRSVSDTAIQRAVERMRGVRCLMQYHDLGGPLWGRHPCDANLGIAWDLAHRATGFRHSPVTFWGLEGKLLDSQASEIVPDKGFAWDYAPTTATGGSSGGKTGKTGPPPRRFPLLDVFTRRPANCTGCEKLPIQCRQVGDHLVCKGRGRGSGAEHDEGG